VFRKAQAERGALCGRQQEGGGSQAIGKLEVATEERDQEE